MNRQFIEVRLSGSNYIMVPVDHIDNIRLQYGKLEIRMASGYTSVESYEDVVRQYHEIKARLMGVDPR